MIYFLISDRIRQTVAKIIVSIFTVVTCVIFLLSVSNCLGWSTSIQFPQLLKTDQFSLLCLSFACITSILYLNKRYESISALGGGTILALLVLKLLFPEITYSDSLVNEEVLYRMLVFAFFSSSVIFGYFRMLQISQFLLSVIFFSSVISLTSYIFYIDHDVRPGFLIALSPSTTAVLLVLSSSLLQKNSHIGLPSIVIGNLPGHKLARRIVPATGLFFLILGFVMIWLAELTSWPSDLIFLFFINAGFVLSMLVIAASVKSINKESKDRIDFLNELKARNKELQQRNTELKELAFISTHDLKEPINSIQSLSSELNSLLNATEDEHVRQVLTYLDETSDRAESLVNDIHQYLVIGGRKKYEEVDMVEVLEEGAQELKSAIEESQAKISWSDDLPIVQMDRTELKIVLFNLLQNSLIFRSAHRAPVIQVKTYKTSKSLIFRISDNGLGIPDKYHNKVFEIFKRVHPRSDKYPGNGIGLAICKKVIQSYQGKIWVEPNNPFGVSVFFTIKNARPL